LILIPLMYILIETITDYKAEKKHAKHQN
jgi:hypothetical protein